MPGGKISAIHRMGDESFGVQSVGHVDAVVPALFERGIHDVFGLRENPNAVEEIGERSTGPVGDVGPAFLASEVGDLGAGGKAPELGQGKRSGAGDQPIDGELPIGERFALVALVVWGGKRGAIDEGRGGDLVAREFAGQGVARTSIRGNVKILRA